MLSRSLIIWLLVSAIFIFGRAKAEPPASRPAASQPRASTNSPAGVPVICVSRSADGLVFRESGRLFAVEASRPTIELLANGELLAIFADESRRPSAAATRPAVEATEAAKTRLGALVACRSKDDGRTWTTARQIRILDDEKHEITATGGALVRHADGSVRLYFAAESDAVTKPEGAARQTPADTVIRLATTRDGISYVCEKVRLAIPGVAKPRIATAEFQGRTHLFISAGAGTALVHEGRPALALHYESKDGRTFSAATPLLQPGAGLVGDAEPFNRILRTYVTAGDGIASLYTPNAHEWRADIGYRIGRGTDPVVARLREGGWLMLYGVRVQPTLARRTGGRDKVDPAVIAASESGDKTEAAEVNSEKQAQTVDPAQPVDTLAIGDPLVLPDVLANKSVPGDAGDAQMASREGWQPFVPDKAAPDVTKSADAPQAGADGTSTDTIAEADSGEAADSNTAASGGERPLLSDASADTPQNPGDKPKTADVNSITVNGESAPTPSDPSDPFAPRPDFVHHVDYIDWYRQRAARMVDDNAYDLYAAFMPTAAEQKAGKEWPEFADLFNDAGTSNIPMPWKPEEHPEWEASRAAAADIMAQFTEATRHAGFARRLEFLDKEDDPNQPKLLFMMMLPDLTHHRRATKRALADGWRLEEGKVSPERMLESWRTSLGSARHLHQGTTLIEHLVGTAEQTMVEKNARAALQHNVFKTADEMELALNTLVEHDRDDTDPSLWLTGEHAFVMDTVQFLFKPEKPGDPPAMNQKNFEYVQKLGLSDDESAKKIRDMTLPDAQRTVDAANTYFREAGDMMRTGYPTHKHADLDALARRHIGTSPISQTFLPAVGRVFALRARNEASRRATQLSYAVHIFKSREGRWPASLDELPVQHARLKTDPFTGGNFGYRLTDSGPTIYSLSENGRDDGGVHSQRWDDEPNGESDDHVFWPVQDK